MFLRFLGLKGHRTSAKNKQKVTKIQNIPDKILSKWFEFEVDSLEKNLIVV